MYTIIITKEWLAVNEKTITERSRTSKRLANQLIDQEYILIKNLQKHHAVVAELELLDNGESIRKVKIDR
jgi:hypothetical protein